MAPDLRFGVIGTSWYADSMHLPSLVSHPNATVTAICGRTRSRAEEIAAKYNIPQVYTDFRQLIDSGEVDAVVIATPDDTHLSMALAAIDAGLHIICEKPLALTLAEARRMAERAEARGVKHMTYFTLRWFQHTRLVKELLEAGTVGACNHCQISYVHGNGLGGQYRWRLDGDRANGILGDLGSHLIDLARWFNGEIVRVAAQLPTIVQRSHPDGQAVTPANDACLLSVEFANGSVGTIHASSVAYTGGRGLEQHIILYGDAGTVEADMNFGNFGSGSGVNMAVRSAVRPDGTFVAHDIPAHIWGSVSPETVDQTFTHDSVGDRYFIDCVLNDQPVTPSLWDGVAVQAVIEAALNSYKSGKWVAVEKI